MQEQKREFHCPRWDELPDIPLYLDQLVMVVQSAIGIFFDDEAAVTKAMINNYVKQQLLDPPEQKKYGRDHIARIIAISLLKRVFSMNEIHYFIRRMVEKHGVQVAYDMFCERFENMLASAFGEINKDITIPLAQTKTRESYLFTAIVMTLVYKLKVQDVIDPLLKEQDELLKKS